MPFFPDVSAPAAPAVSGGGTPTQGGSFLPEVSAPTKPSGGGFLSEVGYDPQAYSQYIDKGKEQVAKAQSDYANSPIGLATNTIKNIPSQVGGEIYNAWKSGAQQELTGGAEVGKSFQKGDIGGVASGALKVGAGAVNATFSPLAPVFKPIGDAIQAAGDAIGNNKALQDWAVQNPEQFKKVKGIMQDIQNASVIASVLVPGAGIAKGVADTTLKGAKAATDIKTLPVKDMSPNGEQINTYTPAKPTSELPTIQTQQGGSKYPTNIKQGTPLSKEPVTTVEPIKNEVASTVSKPTPAEVTTKNEVVPTAAKPTTDNVVKPTAPERPILKNGQRVTKTANDINAKLIAQDKGALTNEQMKTYEAGSYEGSTAKVNEIAKTDMPALTKMATTGEGIPKGVFPPIVRNFILKKAEAEPVATRDYQLIQDLAKSPINKDISSAGGTLGSHGYSKGDNITDTYLNKAKEVARAATKKNTIDNVKGVKAKVSRAAARMMDYNKIIDTIKTC